MVETMSKQFSSLFPSSTSIIDFAYSPSHPLRTGNFDISNDYDSIEGYGWGSDDDNDSDNEYSTIYNHGFVQSSQDSFSPDEINKKAIALFDFYPENDNEVGLTEGQIIWISYRHGQGWLVAEDPESGENGLVPEEYVELCLSNSEEHDDVPKPFLPEILQSHTNQSNSESDTDSEWVDTDYDESDEERSRNLEDVESLQKNVGNVSLTD